jgi:hypothetical protein
MAQATKNKQKMTEILAQTITLTFYGNEYVRTGDLINFYPQNSTF